MKYLILLMHGVTMKIYAGYHAETIKTQTYICQGTRAAESPGNQAEEV